MMNRWENMMACKIAFVLLSVITLFFNVSEGMIDLFYLLSVSILIRHVVL